MRSIGKVSYSDYANLLAEIDIGVSLMLSPHPSYPPLEMASVGAICVTNSYENKNLSEWHPNIISRAATIDEICEGIRLASAMLSGGTFCDPVQARTSSNISYNWDEALENSLLKLQTWLQFEQN
jgi:hypothetical protein